MVTVETYFSADGRLAARRDWRITNALTGELYGSATRFGVVRIRGHRSFLLKVFLFGGHSQCR